MNERQAWVCPLCGCGMAPWVDRCGCAKKQAQPAERRRLAPEYVLETHSVLRKIFKYLERITDEARRTDSPSVAIESNHLARNLERAWGYLSEQEGWAWWDAGDVGFFD